MKKTEQAYFSEDERKKAKIKSEEELKADEEKVLAFKKQKEFVSTEEETEEDLAKLRDLLESHIIDDALVQKVIDHADLEHEEIEAIFEKIDEIEALDDIDDYISPEDRVSKEEYARALHDEESRQIVLGKIDGVLTTLSANMNYKAGGSLNLFGGYMALLDKNLITIQETHIDMKDGLSPDGKPAGLWETFKQAFTKK